MPLVILRTMYFSMTHSYLNYGLLAWGYDSNDKTTKRYVRIIARIKHNVYIQSLMKQLNILRMPDMLISNLMKIYYKYKRSDYFAHFTLQPTHLTTITPARETISGQVEQVSISLKNVFGKDKLYSKSHFYPYRLP